MKVKSIKNMAMLTVSALTLSDAATGNLITNGGFEPNSSGVVYGWNLEVMEDSGAAATLVIDSTSGTAKEGQNFCRITVTAVSSEDWHVQMKDPAWLAKNAMVYHFSVWARSDSPRNATISVYGDPSSEYTWRTSTPINLTTEWQQFHQMFTSDVEGSGKLNFALICGGAPGVYDFDGVVITESEPTDNIYTNGSFEADGAGWNLWVNDSDSATGAATLSFPDAGAQSENKFCRVDVTSASAEDWEIQFQDGPWTCTKNYIYTIDFWAKADSAHRIKVCAQTGSSRDYAYLNGTTLTLNTEWTEYTFSYTSRDLEGPDSLGFVFYCGAAAGKYDFDAITLTGELDSTTPLMPPYSKTENGLWPFSIDLLPEHLQCSMDAAALVPFDVQIFSLQGRLFSTHSITSAVPLFLLPLPPGGTWIIRVNSAQQKMLIVP